MPSKPNPKSKVVPATPQEALTKDRAQFKAELEDRILKGKAIIEKPVVDIQQLEGFKQEFSRWNDYNSELLKQSFNNESSSYRSSYDNAGESFFIALGGRQRTPQERYKELLDTAHAKIVNLEKLVDKIDLLKSEIGEDPVLHRKPVDVRDNKNVFIVHGHNEAVQQSVARVIAKLGLNPIILSEQPSGGKTIIEKFESHSEVGFAIVLLTDDDQGKAKTDLELKSRARQNVVLELGFFIGKLGRQRVLPLYTEGVELPSDIHGLLYVPIDRTQAWKFAIAKELNAAGYSFDASQILHL